MLAQPNHHHQRTDAVSPATRRGAGRPGHWTASVCTSQRRRTKEMMQHDHSACCISSLWLRLYVAPQLGLKEMTQPLSALPACVSSFWLRRYVAPSQLEAARPSFTRGGLQLQPLWRIPMENPYCSCELTRPGHPGLVWAEATAYGAQSRLGYGGVNMVGAGVWHGYDMGMA